MNEYELVDQISESDDRSVHKAIKKTYPYGEYIIKIVNYDKLGKRELDHHLLVHDHPNIVSVINYQIINTELYMVLEKMDCDLFDLLYDPDAETVEEPDFEVIASYLKPCALALSHCHSRGIVFVDLKPENVLIRLEDNCIKICDFGHSLKIGTLIKRSGWGTPAYHSPEIINGQYHIDPKHDAWTLGILAYELIFGQVPFGSDPKRIMNEKLQTNFVTENPDAQDFIERLLVKDPQQRTSVSDILRHPFLNN